MCTVVQHSHGCCGAFLHSQHVGAYVTCQPFAGQSWLHVFYTRSWLQEGRAG